MASGRTPEDLHKDVNTLTTRGDFRHLHTIIQPSSFLTKIIHNVYRTPLMPKGKVKGHPCVGEQK